MAAAEPDGTLDLLAVGPNGAVLHSRFLNGVWQQPVVAAGVPAVLEYPRATVSRSLARLAFSLNGQSKH